jgi:succinate dehydrogenase/fumarate reductase flavoprotein subunit
MRDSSYVIQSELFLETAPKTRIQLQQTNACFTLLEDGINSRSFPHHATLCNLFA